VHALATVDLLASLGVVLAWMRKSYVHTVERWVMIAEWVAAAFFLLNYTFRLLRAGLAPGAAASLQARALCNTQLGSNDAPLTTRAPSFLSPQGFVDLLTAIPLALQGGPYSTWMSFSFCARPECACTLALLQG
jgi:hypothetical protein